MTLEPTNKLEVAIAFVFILLVYKAIVLMFEFCISMPVRNPSPWKNPRLLVKRLCVARKFVLYVLIFRVLKNTLFAKSKLVEIVFALKLLIVKLKAFPIVVKKLLVVKTLLIIRVLKTEEVALIVLAFSVFVFMS